MSDTPSRKQERRWLLSVPSVVLVFAASYSALILLWHARQGHPLLLPFLAFVFLVLGHLGYYVWLVATKRLGRAAAIFYVPAAIALFILFAYWFVRPPYLRWVHLDLGEDPFVPGTSISSESRIPIWRKEFFYPRSRLEVIAMNRLRIARQGSLIGHVGSDLQGWSASKIEYAFGAPETVRKSDAQTEIWIYHPWTDHVDWEMPVYVQNGSLLKIGT